jgi:hypothetical protein
VRLHVLKWLLIEGGLVEGHVDAEVDDPHSARPATDVTATDPRPHHLSVAATIEAVHLAPPTLEPHRIVRNADVLHGELVRDPEAPGPYGQVPSWAHSQLSQNGQQGVAGDGDGELPEATKRHQVEAYLAALGPGQLGRLSSLGPRAAARELTGALTGQGVQVSERYVQQIFDDWTAARRQANGRRRTR